MFCCITESSRARQVNVNANAYIKCPSKDGGDGSKCLFLLLVVEHEEHGHEEQHINDILNDTHAYFPRK